MSVDSDLLGAAATPEGAPVTPLELLLQRVPMTPPELFFQPGTPPGPPPATPPGPAPFTPPFPPPRTPPEAFRWWYGGA